MYQIARVTRRYLLSFGVLPHPFRGEPDREGKLAHEAGTRIQGCRFLGSGRENGGHANDPQRLAFRELRGEWRRLLR